MYIYMYINVYIYIYIYVHFISTKQFRSKLNLNHDSYKCFQIRKSPWQEDELRELTDDKGK